MDRLGWSVAIGVVLFTVLPLRVHAQGRVDTIAPPACGECRIRLDSVVSLGDTVGLGMLETEQNWLRTDSRGRYYVSAVGPPYFWVFGPEGRILDRVGRGGEGPGEFQFIVRVLVDRQDSVFVVDGPQRRVSVFSSDLEFARSFQTPLSIGYGVFNDPQLVVNGSVRTPTGVGYPLHVLTRRGEVVRSFGSVLEGEYDPDLRYVMGSRAVTGADDGGVWSGWRNQYVLERWDTAGQLTRTLIRTPEWFPTWWRREVEEVEKEDVQAPSPHIGALQQREGVLWVMLGVPAPEWRSTIHVDDNRMVTILDLNRYQHTIIEAIDLEAGEVIASTRFPRTLMGFAGPGLVYGMTTDRIGNPVVPVWRLRIHGTPDGN